MGEIDDAASDERPVRRVLLIVGSTVLTLLVTVAGFLVGRDRSRIDLDIARAQLTADQAEDHAGKNDVKMGILLTQQEGLSLSVAEVKRQGEKNEELLRSVLLEMRRK